ncbi:unnamed protein product [Menidia menidia]|nr:unnamed protein product [Menidia menidia]
MTGECVSVSLDGPKRHHFRYRPLRPMGFGTRGVMPSHQHLKTERGDPLLEEDAPLSLPLRCPRRHFIAICLLTDPPYAIRTAEPGAEQQDQGAPTCSRTRRLDEERRSLRALGGKGSDCPGEAGLQFLGTSAKGSAAVRPGGRRLQRFVMYYSPSAQLAPIVHDLLFKARVEPRGRPMSILARYHLLPSSLVLLILLAVCTMGCIQSIACKPRIRRENIVVYEVSASIDQCPTIIEENSPIVLRYKTPYFRASAGVVMPPVPRNETWVVGWIQACTQMEFYNTYGDIGMSSWELPELREGRVKAISDSDGVSYPWYGNTTETVTLTGPTSKPSRLTVSMNDNFYPSVTWAVPISNSNTPMLTHITRDQSFITWLVAMNSVTKERIVLQTVRWRMRVDIAVDPDMPLGSRASLVGRPYQEQPHILNYQEPIPPNALGRPNANDAQVLMWRPRRGAPLVVIPPK